MNQVKRILLVHWTRPPVGGGVESHLIDLANGLAARSYNVFLVTGTRAGALEFNETIQLIYSPDLDLFQRANPYTPRSIHHNSTLDKLISRLRPDVVHGHNLDHFGGGPLKSLLVAKARNSFLFVHTSHSVPSDPIGTTLLPFVDARLAVSHSLCKILNSLTAARFSCLYLPVDSTRFKSNRKPLDEEQIKILLPARLVPEKGSLVALRALQAVRQEGIDASLILARPVKTIDGRRACDHEHMVKTVARRLNIYNHVIFESFPPFEMPQIYSIADIVILPSLFVEPFGLAALEGMSCSRPVVVTTRSGLAELLHDWETGITLGNMVYKDLAATIRVVVAARTSARRLGIRARQFVEARCTINAFLDAIEKNYCLSSVLISKDITINSAESTAVDAI